MEKVIIDFLNRLYDLTYDFDFMKKCIGVTMVAIIILSVVFEAKRRKLSHE